MGRTSFLSALACLVALAGCGAATLNDDDDQPDADTTDAGPDTEAPLIVSSDPDDNGISVSVLDSLHVTFNEPLDPDTVNETTVQVGGTSFIYGGGRIEGDISYDASTYTITFDPIVPIPHGDSLFGYSLIVGGVTDVAGNSFAGDLRPFWVYRNSQLRSIQYTAATGVPTGYTRYTLDDEGRQVRDNRITGPGTDAIWFTADDVIADRGDFEYTDAGLVYRAWEYNAPGTDTMWNTDDDVINSLVTLVYDADNKIVQYDFHLAPGTDTEWGTEDDEYDQWVAFEYTLLNMTRQVIYSDPGVDLEWFTADDVPIAYVTQEFNTANLATLQVQYDGAGVDLEWLTADDEISSVTSSEYDDQNRQTRFVRYQGPGLDAEWLTADDEVDYWYDYQYDDVGLTRSAYYTGAGVDGDWLTADDDVNSYTTYSNNAVGQILDEVYYNSPGVDTDWFTSDDVAYGHDGFAYDANLQTTTSYDYAAGTDTLYGTDDDVINRYSGISYDARGNRIRERSYADFGIDGEWETGDDRFSSGIEFNTEL